MWKYLSYGKKTGGVDLSVRKIDQGGGLFCPLAVSQRPFRDTQAGPLSGPLSNLRALISFYKTTIIIVVRRPLLGTTSQGLFPKKRNDNRWLGWSWDHFRDRFWDHFVEIGAQSVTGEHVKAPCAGQLRIQY